VALQEPKTLAMQINHRRVEFPEGVTVLRAAELNGIKIPSLCSHKDLSAFGSCRMCMVEIEGMRGYPLACDTRAQEGMKVLTESVRLRELRIEILKLLLSEHPSSCLLCDESDDCKEYQGTIRKTGVSTGCRFCPNDHQCELQDLVEELGIKDIDYPIYYRGLEPEQDDPFYDRDYNICVLCGRCVRMCQEVRGTSVLAFSWRGRKAKIGTAFDRSHVQAGCEFCGACVDICPTGALADKASKWDGKPDGFITTTCPFCAVGCQLDVAHKDGRLSSAKAALDPEINDGQICVKGRFCMPEATHHFTRARKPMVRKGRYFRESTWEEAIHAVAAAISTVQPADIAMLVSPDLSCEGLFSAGWFADSVIPGASLDTSARDLLPGGAQLWKAFFSKPISLKDISRCDTILSVGLDTRFHFSIVGVQIRRAIAKGAKLIAVDARSGNLTRYTDDWLQPMPGTEGALLVALAAAISGETPDSERAATSSGVAPEKIAHAVKMLASGHDIAVLVGPQAIQNGGPAVLAAMASLLKSPSVRLVPFYFGANSRGVLELGMLDRTPSFGIEQLRSGSVHPKVLYLVGEVPFSKRPDCDFLVVQDIYLPPFDADVFLPAASFAEAKGTLINIEGRLQEASQIESFPDGMRTGFARPDWWTFTELAAAVKVSPPALTSLEAVQAAISTAFPGIPAKADRMPRVSPEAFPPGVLKAEVTSLNGSVGKFRLVPSPAGFTHRGINLVAKVEGLAMLALEEGIRMNPADLKTLGIPSGSEAEVCVTGTTTKAIAISDAECPAGCAYFTVPTTCGGIEHRTGMQALFKHTTIVGADIAPATGSSTQVGG